MKRFLLLLATLVAGVLIIASLPVNATAAGQSELDILGRAHLENGSLCNNSCLAVAFDQYHGTTTSGAVSNFQINCGGHFYNFGAYNLNGCPNANNNFYIQYPDHPTVHFDVWIRKPCPFSGFHYSPQFHFQTNGNRDTIWAGELQLQSGPCFPANVTDVGLKAALIG